MTDYEKARAECWKELCDKTAANSSLGDTTKSAFDFIFLQAYRYGRWVAMEEAKKVARPDLLSNSEQLNLFRDDTKKLRAQAAIAAMQGLLSNPDITTRYETVLNDAAHDAVVAVNYLFAELDKTKENDR